MFCAFQVLSLQIPLFFYENGASVSAIALCVEKMLPPTMYPLITFISLSVFYLHKPNNELTRWEKLFCCAFSLFLIIGDSYNAIDSWDLVFGSVLLFLMSVATLVGFTIITQCGLCWLKDLGSKLLKKEVTMPALWEKHPFLFAWAVIFLCWVPYIIIRLPAAVDYDSYKQLEEIFGYRTFSNYNPVFSTVLIGTIFKFGAAVFGFKEAGLTVFVIFQALVCSAILAYTTLTMKRLNTPPIIRVIALGVYSLVTMYPNYLTVILKDSLYSCMSILLLALVIEEVMLPHSKKRCLGILAAGLLTGLLRNNGFLILWALLLASAVYCLLHRKHRRTYMAAMLLIACLLQSMFVNVMLPALNIPAGPMGESLSIPFQQTARYVRDYPEDVTPEEAEAIAAVLDYEHLAELYNPDVSDPVKFSNTGNHAALPEYFKAWFKMFLRHPDAYIEATLNNAYGFFHPNAREYIFQYSALPFKEGKIPFEEIDALYPAKIATRYLVMLFETFPLTLPLCNCGWNMWLALYLMCTALARKDRKLMIPFASIGISMLVCIACPVFFVNGIRYALPVIFANPLMVAVTLRKSET